MKSRDGSKEGWGRVSNLVLRFVWGALPIVVCILLLRLYADGTTTSSPPMFIAVCAVCAIVLWFGWKSVRCNIITKWIGAVLALYFGLVLVLSVFGIAMGLSLILLPFFMVLLPLLMYDLLFRAPSESQADHESR